MILPAPPARPLTASSLASLNPAKRRASLGALSDAEVLELLYRWRFWARENQLAPKGDWETWLLLAGRGFGKTRAGAEWVRAEIESGRRRRLALIAPTARDARKIMVEGEAGLLAICPPWFRPCFEPSRFCLTWPNGATADLYSAAEPERLRGPTHDGAWADELAAWRYLDETWTNLELTLRSGAEPKRVVTTTPKPRHGLKALIADPKTIVTRGATYDNAANLAPQFLARLERKYRGTRIGRQELLAELLEEAEGALWRRAGIESLRVVEAPVLCRIVVAIDPAAGEQGAETGIVVAGLGEDAHAYVLADLSGRMSPKAWAERAIDAYRGFAADRVVAEVNQGGEMVAATLRMIDPEVSFKALVASRGKRARAEPIAALYEQGRAHHVGAFPELEDQMVGFAPYGEDRRGQPSPDRLDALVWALSELMVTESGDGLIRYYRALTADKAKGNT